MSSQQVQSDQLYDYLVTLPGTTFRKLYQQPSAALSIFRRMLSPVSQTMVKAILYMPDPFPLEQMYIWFKSGEAKKECNQALAQLRSLHIATISALGKDKPQEVQLSSSFKKGFRLALEGGGEHNSFGVPSDRPVDPAINIPFLDQYARKKWEDILHYVVNSVKVSADGSGGGFNGGSGGGPKTSVKDLLLAGRLVERRSDTRTGVGITQAGFTFLLQKANDQVWTLLLLWHRAIETSAASNDPNRLDGVDLLSFLFMLATLKLGHAYDTSALTDSRRNMLPYLVDFGLIYIPHDTRQYFPTRLATALTSNPSAMRAIEDQGSNGALESATNGFIIIETNYRLYAYTSSPLQISIIALFANMSMRFPTMCSARLSRESVRRAIGYGINAEQIIEYLRSNAHEQMRRYATATGKPVLPPTVTDQIRLWQLENERMSNIGGFLFKDFDSTEEYEAVSRYAEEVGVLRWRNDKKGMFFASKYEPIRDYLKSRKSVK